ncbi:uncharacterized protein LOC126573455 [Anopheles aquasalis]|uniref:uncharacterized protein LOC126573455 n=1 Tax=Anopheles aquasalis TaxID=42839 RepID=UPI00215A3285|nr:uncharacterized protein LOC126573455 [Anopheles aquasalis]
MKATLFSLTLLGAVLSVWAIPRPDLGIKGVVPAASDIGSTAINLLQNRLNRLDNNFVNLTSGYTRIDDMNAALQSIGTAVLTKGGSLANALAVLSMSTTGPVATAFGLVYTELDNFQLLVNGSSLTTEIETLANNTYPDTSIIVDIGDAFGGVNSTLIDLRSALQALEANVQSAQTAAGNAPTVSSTIIRTKIPTRSVTAVTTQVRNLYARIPSLGEIIDSTIRQLQTADDFIIATKLEGERVTGGYSIDLVAYQDNLEQVKSDYYTELSTQAGFAPANQLENITNDLSAFYANSTIDEAIAGLNTTFNSLAGTIFDAFFTTYNTSLGSLVTDMDTDFATMLCDPLREAVQVLINNGVDSAFCFEKYSNFLFNVIGETLDDIDVCFQNELLRLFHLQDVLGKIGVQLSYNVEDLLANLQVCLALPAAAQAGCFDAIDNYYSALDSETTLLVGSVSEIVNFETVASMNRLGACVKIVFPAKAAMAAFYSSETTNCYNRV